LQRGIGEDTAPAASGKFTALVVEPMETLDHIHGLPGLARSDQGRRETDGMKRDVVLTEKLDVMDVVRLPPLTPVTSGGILLRPFLGCCDVGDRSIEPNIENLLLEAGPRHWYAPGEVAGNAAVTQVRADPAARQRVDERRPATPRAKPGTESIDQQR